MRTAIACLVVAALARAQESAAVRDPALLLPLGTPIYAEADDLGASAALLARSAFLAPLEPPVRARIDELLGELGALGVRRAAVGVLPALIFPTRWIVLAETADPAPIVAFIVKRAKGADVKPAAGAAGPFAVVADAESTVATVLGLRDGKGEALAAREDFKRFRSRFPTGAVRLHLDVQKLAPAALRFGLKKNDAGSVLFGHHLMHAARTARTLSGGLELGDPAALRLVSEIAPVPPKAAFTETRPSEPVLAHPDGCALRVSLARDLRRFWTERESLLAASARAPIAEFQNNLAILMGGLSVEDVFAGIGSSFDAYVARGDPAAQEGRRYPSVAVVAALRDPALANELLLSFQTTVGIVNAQRAMEGLPRLLQESSQHRGVTIASARLLAEALPDAGDDRTQLVWSFAIAKDRVIVGTRRELVAALVDAAVDGRTEARVAGDEARLAGPAAAVLVRDASAFLRARMALKDGRPAEDAQRVLDAICVLLAKTDAARARVLVDGELATIETSASGRALIGAGTESR
jgi:hypothetical protein